MTETKLRLEDWLDDLCVRFIINLPREELESVERICFQVEEAQWFYEDFVRPLDPALPSLSLKAFAMRIFQHCPLMSEWSEYHHAAAFSEFLAYKTRVPVRGAILLNHDMDKVVLVKGWKKNANWSFPRGKINKEEKDLDCAVREVLEETGYDLKAAGLVKDEKHMKHIEITMREQHMKLYVFRGVPMDTVFAPQTRKEISRIEWVNLSDLPTVKKNKQHDAVNANKFYMVAPFLNPLKKWISQQRKLDAKNNFASMAYTEGETSMDEGFVSANNGFTPVQAHIQPAIPSELPKVTPTLDVSSHLKRLLNIGGPAASPSTTSPPTDPSKSNALLSLLRSGTSGTSILASGTPQQSTQQPPVSHKAPNLLNQVLNPVGGMRNQINAPFQPSLAPYQRTGDPLFAQRAGQVQTQGQIVPPASKLPPPKLTSHSLALLNVLKGNQPEGISATKAVELAGQPVQPVQPAPKQILQRPTSLGNSTAPAKITERKPPDALTSATVSGPLRTPDFDKTPKSNRGVPPGARGKRPQQQASPVRILSRPPSARKDMSTAPPSKGVSTPPAQTSTSASLSLQEIISRSKIILSDIGIPSAYLFGSYAKGEQTEDSGIDIALEFGEKLRLPDWPKIADAKEELEKAFSKKVDLTVCPSKDFYEKIKDHMIVLVEPKTFQPTILRRSEKLDLNSLLPVRTTHELPQELSDIPLRQKSAVPPGNKVTQPNYDRRPSQTAAQKETLLSLFGKSPPTKTSLLASSMEHPIASSPFNNATPSPSLSGAEPTVPAGAVPSIDSASDYGSRTPGAAQRMKSPDNKAFLLGFLQNVAERKK
ncbi:decapping enzyme Dcp2, putative [Talaromyces stipitatus ATCC 10500]|uniref:Decapping enzyme Dcp2, putative n=1 Tax=Talaromyces stipitatus (strain ATCC 10500 / CBS 375.48 / QM 6759 / NRRL 1006) TaxID=441959 RepID=B8M1L6_TALSN|nr:decapping enzyme Dcp2, putative [Talaromyces stipitatus ATCC 10500]EED22103.1 decapping enzyme Dcp2, putative [Talaromyces stipitatus ATCC 10500]